MSHLRVWRALKTHRIEPSFIR